MKFLDKPPDQVVITAMIVITCIGLALLIVALALRAFHLPQ